MSMTAYDFHQLVDVRLRKLLIPWEENALEQWEYYSCFGAQQTAALYREQPDVLEIHVVGELL